MTMKYHMKVIIDKLIEDHPTGAKCAIVTSTAQMPGNLFSTSTENIYLLKTQAQDEQGRTAKIDTYFHVKDVVLVQVPDESRIEVARPKLV